MIYSKATFSFQTFLRLVRGVLTKSVTCVTRTLARKMTNRVYLRSDFINMPQKCVIGIYLNLKMNPNWVQCKFRLLHTVFDILREPKISVRMVFYPWLINLNIVQCSCHSRSNQILNRLFSSTWMTQWPVTSKYLYISCFSSICLSTNHLQVITATPTNLFWFECNSSWAYCASFPFPCISKLVVENSAYVENFPLKPWSERFIDPSNARSNINRSAGLVWFGVPNSKDKTPNCTTIDG